ncbi:hypothetical protein TRAPUB_13663 [Trametes pubescens]|uniref:Uncharacterized protein n=1 Tax=Trametes pubescens TaxID=154538 RepID=A0A1M2V3L7_TRAPU|nr:hypothetical protein TRAPUB_7395 [Trametes pubescens]OJT08919.1 hypothetical protein TRAPUB_184 [Trametes pubescens]OJT08927.1 hypothetical protein TRAPUB_175 [Trametes pubescens]OJT09851.1 hypothetical protein TRAPUB_13663 [Trametes pubescens]
MSTPPNLDCQSARREVAAISLVKMTLDIDMRTLLDEHRLSPLRPQLWVEELVESLQTIDGEYRQRFAEKVFGQARMLRKLTAPADFDAKLTNMLQSENEIRNELSKIEEMYKHKRNQMNPAQRSFFDDLFSTTRRSHKTFVFEAKGTRVNFDALRPLLGFLSQSQEQLNGFLSSLPPYAAPDAIRSAVTPAVDEFKALISQREEILQSAYRIELEATLWEEKCVPYSERAESLAQLKQLRDDLKAQRTLQNAACTTINRETTTANGAPHALSNVPGTTQKLCDLLGVATQYAALDRFGSMLEEDKSASPWTGRLSKCPETRGHEGSTQAVKFFGLVIWEVVCSVSSSEESMLEGGRGTPREGQVWRTFEDTA